MIPFYDDGQCVIYHGDSRQFQMPVKDVALVLTDPPYGCRERTDRASKGRGKPFGCKSETRSALAPSYDFPPVAGDDEPFDPRPWLAYRRVILFGANHFAERLPPSNSWIVWDKLRGLSTPKRLVGFDDNGDAELAWSNLGGPPRTISYRWKGLMKDGERSERRVHPTQKPVALFERLILWRTNPGDLILDPYMGSGSVLLAAQRTGRRAIGIELERRYCRVAARRLRNADLIGKRQREGSAA